MVWGRRCSFDRSAGRRSVQHTPDAVSGRDIGVLHIRYFADQGDTEMRPRPKAIVGIGSSSLRGWHGAIAEDLEPDYSARFWRQQYERRIVFMQL